ncbi:hypothetical protein FRC06_000974, partial [Ceratobasidium sp. 370]
MSSQVVHDTVMEEAEERESGNDRYCYICEDGGPMVECSICSNSCCFDVMGEQPENPIDGPGAQGCVTIPKTMTGGSGKPFLCPSCLSKSQPRALNYVINRGARTTMRLASRTALALVVYHLHAHTDWAKALAEQLQSALAVFEVNVATHVRLLHLGTDADEATELLEQLVPGTPYHLAVVFLTEGSPGGGWWYASRHGKQTPSQVDEKQFLAHCLSNLRSTATLK